VVELDVVVADRAYLSGAKCFDDLTIERVVRLIWLGRIVDRTAKPLSSASKASLLPRSANGRSPTILSVSLTPNPRPTNNLTVIEGLVLNQQ
jgi:hypothetical protein